MKTNIKNILVPIDFSNSSLNALNTAIQMAKRHDAVIHLLYIQDIMSYYPQLSQLAVTVSMMEDIWQKDEVLLEKMLAAICHTHQVHCQLYVEAGYRSTVIAERSVALRTDITVLGIEPELKDQSFLIDSLPYKILKNGAGHLLTVPAKKEINDFKKIIFPILSQEDAAYKLDQSQDIIEVNNSEISVIGIVRKEDIDLLTPIQEVSDRIKRRLKLIAGAVNRNSRYTVDLSEELISIPKKRNAQLLVMQADTRRNVKEFFFGNLAQRLLRKAEVAIFFVKNIHADVNDHFFSEASFEDGLKLSY